ncbi:hypothetical protein [Methanogenium cariaci]|uniref:hypothetical protein n=1 Tax=Methanogenium cariaci TaxID=2197 RepID=UPI000785210C|nr:hypothetical protein [Methanogenium cariaci]
MAQYDRGGERPPRFALVIRDEGEERETTDVSVFRLLRLIAREEPDILAVDSVQEIARDQKALFSFLQSLPPPRTMLVQSTGGEKQESLPRVAARYNMKFNRLDLMLRPVPLRLWLNLAAVRRWWPLKIRLMSRCHGGDAHLGKGGLEPEPLCP